MIGSRSIAALAGQIGRLPRTRIARLPTPLDELPRLSDQLGVRVLVKREDMTGLAFGGNKARELDFFIADAQQADADVFVAGGGTGQSNHAVQCSAAARRAGMIPVMVLHRIRADDPQGNLLLDRLLQADLRFVDTNSVDSAINQRDVLRQRMEEAAEDYRNRGHRPYVLPSSFHPLGAVAYVDAACEMAGQLLDQSLSPDHVYVTSGGATQVGLALGFKHLGSQFDVMGISYTLGGDELAQRMVELGDHAAARLEIDTRLQISDLPNESFAGPGYGVPTPEGLEAIRLLAQTEGMFLDPVYTGKGMSGLLAHIRSGRVRQGETVVFVHTGGLPSLFAYNQILVGDEK